jgi:hypothetical protein
LIVHRADDQPMIVANHWLLQHGADGLEALVTEVHSDIVTPGTPGANELADVVATIAQELSQPLTAVGGFVAGAQRAATPRGQTEVAWIAACPKQPLSLTAPVRSSPGFALSRKRCEIRAYATCRRGWLKALAEARA